MRSSTSSHASFRRPPTSGDDPARRNRRNLAATPHIQAFLRLRVTNARTEGGNRVIKQLTRVGCGYRDQGDYERRTLLQIAAKNAAGGDERGGHFTRHREGPHYRGVRASYCQGTATPAV